MACKLTMSASIRTAAVVVFFFVLGWISGAPKNAPQILPSVIEAARPEIVFVQAPVVAPGGLAGRFPQGSRLVRLGTKAKGVSLVNLTPEFFAVADPQVWFDGTRVLFAGQKDRGALWQIWQMALDGSAKRQVMRCEGDCLRPAYLPSDEIVFTLVASAGPRSVSQVYVAGRDGSEARPITFGPGNFQVETVLRNGLILVSADWPLLPGGASDSSRMFYTVRPDGTGLASFRCEHQQHAVRAEAQELDDGSVVYVKSTRPRREAGGELAEIPRGGLHNAPVGPLGAISWSPRRLGSEKLIVARKNDAPGARQGRFDLYAFDAVRGQFGQLIYADRMLSSVQAVPAELRPVPSRYWSTLNPDFKTGYFICLNSYRSAEVPKGRISSPIATVRVLALDAVTGREWTLGEAPVETDGSFYVSVPADQPLRFELLNPEGRVVGAQRSWVWARPGEEHGCVGCHEDKALAPENRWPLTLRRFDTPTPLGVQNSAGPAH